MTLTLRSRQTLILTVCLIGLSACGGGGTTATPAVPPATASITLAANITADDIISNIEATAGNAISIIGTTGGDVADGDTVTLAVNNIMSTSSVSSNAFSIAVAVADLVADADTTIDASVTTSTANPNGEATATDSEGYSVEVPIPSQTLVDPTPGVNNQFGARSVILANGNIVVTDPFDSSVATSNGAVHLYNPVTQTLIASVFGDNAGDRLGSNGITALTNNHFVIASRLDDEGGIVDTGSVRLVNGVSGVQIGAALVGATADDFEDITVTASATANFYLVAAPLFDANGLIDSGFVWLIAP